MANDLTVSGATRLSWSLTGSDTNSSASVVGDHPTRRSIANGTGPGQANVATTRRITCTGSGNTTTLATIPFTPFGSTGSASLTTVRELLVSIASGPSGGFLNVAAPGGITGVRVGVGGQVHWADYTVGATGTSVVLSGGPTGTYTVDLTLIGVGSYT